MTDLLATPLTLPCGAVLPNRLAKAAMTEGVANRHLQASERHQTLYRRWAEGGCGLLLTGNVQIDKRVLERPGNVAIDNNGGIEALEAWARAGTSAGNHLWMQISHAGRQCPRYVAWQPLAPSPVQLKLMSNYGKPRALREDEIIDLIGRYAKVAKVAQQTGFTGVQVHGAHGYLISSFLSPVTNQREDQWGGSLANRSRLLLEVVRATRKAVGPDYPVALKLNSADFQQGGFSNEDCLQLVEWLNEEGLDLLELSGGTYEQPRLLGFEGKAKTADKRQSTVKREAYFLEYAAKIREISKMPLMVTGGFRSRAAMVEALGDGQGDGDTDVIGLARPLCGDPMATARLLAGELDELPRYELSAKLVLGKGRWGPASGSFAIKLIHMLGQQGWYYNQIARLADGKPANFKLGLLRAFFWYLFDEYSTAFRMKR